MAARPWHSPTSNAGDTTSKMNDILGNLTRELDTLESQRNQITGKAEHKPNPFKSNYTNKGFTMQTQKVSPIKFDYGSSSTTPTTTAPKTTYTPTPKNTYNPGSLYSNATFKEEAAKASTTSFPAAPPAEDNFPPPPPQMTNSNSASANSFPAPPASSASKVLTVSDTTPIVSETKIHVGASEKAKPSSGFQISDIEGLDDLDSPLVGRGSIEPPKPLDIYGQSSNPRGNAPSHSQSSSRSSSQAPAFTPPKQTPPPANNDVKTYNYKVADDSHTKRPNEYYNLYGGQNKPKTEADASAEIDKAIEGLTKGLHGTDLDKEIMSRDNCGKCGKPILTEAATVLGQSFHPDCFTCVKCGCLLKTGVEFFVVGKDQPHCANCYSEMLTTCYKCDSKIESGRIVKALGHDYHPECFTCTICNKGLDGQQFASDKDEHGNRKPDAKPYCVDCYAQKFAPKCARCTQPIIGANASISRIIVGSDEFHSSCFVCKKDGCDKSLKDGAYPQRLSAGDKQELFCHAHALEIQRAAMKNR